MKDGELLILGRAVTPIYPSEKWQSSGVHRSQLIRPFSLAESNFSVHPLCLEDTEFCRVGDLPLDVEENPLPDSPSRENKDVLERQTAASEIYLYIGLNILYFMDI